MPDQAASWSVAVDLTVDGIVDPRVQSALYELCDQRANVTAHLIGPAAALDAAAREGRSAWHEQFRTVVAEGLIGPDEDPAVVRGRPSVPVRVALDLLAERVVDTVWSVASPKLVITAATFRLARAARGAPDADPRSAAAGRLRGAARPGLCREMLLARGSLRVVDAGAADRATPVDVAGRLLAVSRPGDRVGVLDPIGHLGAFGEEVRGLCASAGLDVVAVDAHDAASGAVDVVGCTPELGAVLVDTLRACGVRSTGLSRIVGLQGEVAVVRPVDLEPAYVRAAWREDVA